MEKLEFDKIYTTYFNDVYLYIKRLSKNEQIAEEITSDTFFKAMRSIGSFRGDCDIRVWLCQIAKYSYYNYQKRAGCITSIEELVESELADPSQTFDELLAQHEQAANIQKLLHELPEPYKEVFMWRIFGELSFKQIGAIFNKSENWACVTFHRAKKKLKERMEESR